MEARARNRTSEEATTTTFDRQDDGAPERRIDFYCVALVMAGSYEVALMENAVAKGASVFQCSGYDVFSGESLHLGVHAISGKEVVANVVEGPLEVEKGGAYGTALNSEVFARVWKLIFEDGLFAQHDWTVKVDPDCVFLASRLEHHLQHERLRAEDSLYLNNCKDGLHGPLEVVSRGGMQAFGDGLDSCVEDLRFEWSTYGEDVFLRHCLGLRSVTRVDLFELLDETFDGTPPSCDSQAVAFHPLKSTESYSACLATSSPLEEAA
ncbi:unnamed protein product [Prorocentrum cordatum]|uniref:Uncharacterized protein n=1 Tax=Prorocentrum cordatum TaxID=2364126 RepID=A0ABN9TR16_9DINO|nr:unnamed protein product [Polarella glacialis]